MSESYLAPEGDVIQPDELRITRARAVATAIKKLDYVSLVECRRKDATAQEIVVFDSEVERGQVVRHDIRSQERLAIIFDPADKTLPDVISLRNDFPHVPHLNLRENEFPRSLCLYEETLEEANLRWTAVNFVGRIRNWLASTARGDLHADDQPLEPLLQASPVRIVLPYDFLSPSRSSGVEFLTVEKAVQADSRLTLIAEYEARNPQNAPEYVASVLIGAPQAHGIIRQIPQNLQQLHEFVKAASIDLLAALRGRIRDWYLQKSERNFLKSRLALILVLPKTRSLEGPVETVDKYAFLLPRTILEIGEAIGVIHMHEGKPGLVMVPDTTKIGLDIAAVMANPSTAFSRELAATQNGLPEPVLQKIVAVGLGALGSQVFMNLIRAGFGQWTLIDDDQLLPHNLARHSLPGSAIGFSKAGALALTAEDIIRGDPVATSINADVLRPPGDAIQKINEAYSDAHVLLDMSTSLAVARHLALDVKSKARRLSLFLNPAGTDMVLLAEDHERRTPLDFLEMIYYRHICGNPDFHGHLAPPSGRIRYGNSCRDLSSSIAQDNVAVHAGMGAKALKTVLKSDDARIVVWRISDDMSNVSSHSLQVLPMVEVAVGDWRIRTDGWILGRILGARSLRLPNETGGILIGSFDMRRKLFYVVQTLLSPPDSKEWPTCYIRGCQGLATRVARIQEVTGGGLEYVGEWHSHPTGQSCELSGDDSKALARLSEIMEADGRPAMMLIVAHDSFAFHLDRTE